MSGHYDIIKSPAPIMGLEAAKAQLRIAHSDEDSHILSLIAAATERVGKDVNSALVSQTNRFHVGRIPYNGKLEVPLGPIIAIEAMSYYNGDGEEISLDISGFQAFSGQRGHAWIQPVHGGLWPSLAYREDALTITYSAGYGSVLDVPAAMVHAAKLLVSELFELRELGAVGVSYTPTQTYWDLLAPYLTYIE